MDSNTIYSHPLPSNIPFKTPIKIRKEGSYEPFVYIVQEKSTGKKYIGSRTANGCKLTDMGSKYFTSSRYVKETWKSNIDSFDVVEIYQCESNHSAFILEEILIYENNAIKRDDYLNKGFGGCRFNGGKTGPRPDHVKQKISVGNKGTYTVRDTETGKILKCSLDDPNYLSGRYASYHKGLKRSDETKERISNKGKGLIMVRDTETNNYLKCEKDDPNYLSGRYVGATKGCPMSEASKNALREANIGTVGVRDTLTGEQFRCKKDDPYYISGRYVSLTNGMKHTEEAKQKVRESKLGTVTVKDTVTGKKFKCSVDDPNYISGRYIPVNKGMKHKRVNCKYCGKSCTPSTVNRWHNENCKYKDDEND